MMNTVRCQFKNCVFISKKWVLVKKKKIMRTHLSDAEIHKNGPLKTGYHRCVVETFEMK